MAYPLIIFGAGASHDFSPLGKMAPLTNDLAEDQFIHSGFLEKYKGAGNLLVEIINQVKSRKRNFEEVLTEIQNDSIKSEAMRRRFVDFEFYLRDLFSYISKPHDLNRKIHQANNYHAIINRIDTYTNGKALIATFNYDSLFENSLSSLKPKNMRDYISSDIKIIKLHGSHDWGYIRRTSEMERKHLGIKDGYELSIKEPDILKEIKEGKYDPYHIQEIEENAEKNDFNSFPAIAIPLIGKDKYVCPTQHIKVFEQHLPQIDRVLIVGWRAEDPLLLETLKNNLPKEGGYKVLVVSWTLEGAQKIAKKVKEGLGILNDFYVQARGNGFSTFMADEASKIFFSQ
ncbi:MAG: hypothetical protein K9L98_02080 [Candidatus Pacebacteria bacterium]|nr:hypothetical protein [Candidatus Paceibacterota bacterium]MCF7862775.1 hypothetical protein [Candidatus Paceibacterota bacterium]